MKKKSILINNLSVSYLDNEKLGPSVIFIHGNSSSSRAFRNQFQSKLNDRFRLIALDLPGHGDTFVSDGESPSYSLPFFATILTRFIERLELGDVIIVGQSFGGHIVLQALDQLPRVKGIMLFGVPPLGNPPNLQEAFKGNPYGGLFFVAKHNDEDARNLADQFFSKPGFSVPVETLVDIKQVDPNFRTRVFEELGKLNLRDEIKIIESTELPVAILHGVDEKLVNGEYIEKVKVQNLWRNEIQYLNGVGHSPHLESPSEFNELVSDFVSDVISQQVSGHVASRSSEVRDVSELQN